MTIQRPTGEYQSQMTTLPEAWPDVDEDPHGQRATELLKISLRLEKAATSWLRTQTSIFDGSTWFGQASDAGKLKVQNASEWMQSVGRMLGSAIEFHRHAYESITNAKNHIIANCDAAQKVIDHLNSLSSSDKDNQQKRDDAVKAIVVQALQANKAVVISAGDAIATGQVFSVGLR
jgi:hypothetical protein